MCIRYYIDHKETSRILLSFCQQLRKVFSAAFQDERSNKYIDGEGVHPSDFFFHLGSSSVKYLFTRRDRET